MVHVARGVGEEDDVAGAQVVAGHPGPDRGLVGGHARHGQAGLGVGPEHQSRAVEAAGRLAAPDVRRAQAAEGVLRGLVADVPGHGGQGDGGQRGHGLGAAERRPGRGRPHERAGRGLGAHVLGGGHPPAPDHQLVLAGTDVVVPGAAGAGAEAEVRRADQVARGHRRTSARARCRAGSARGSRRWRPGRPSARPVPAARRPRRRRCRSPAAGSWRRPAGRAPPRSR